MLELDFHSSSKQKFQCSSASRKFSMIGYGALELTDEVSVLFSEPKILNVMPPTLTVADAGGFQCSSASRKFSMLLLKKIFDSIGDEFQCSSASRKFSIVRRGRVGDPFSAFQCSSASRKFSMPRPGRRLAVVVVVSVLFSEPKILNPVTPLFP